MTAINGTAQFLPRHPRDLLSGWKEISAYLCLSPYRVRSLGYPVRKLPGRAGMGRVWADPAELDAWSARLFGPRLG